MGPQYWDRNQKLEFMDKHGIDVSVVRHGMQQWDNTRLFGTQVSTANPWLDFLSAAEAIKMATDLNADLEEYCSKGPSLADSPTLCRLYGMGLIPIVQNVAVPAVLQEIEHIAELPHLRGVILGTRGLGKGLDDGEPSRRLLNLYLLQLNRNVESCLELACREESSCLSTSSLWTGGFGARAIWTEGQRTCASACSGLSVRNDHRCYTPHSCRHS